MSGATGGVSGGNVKSDQVAQVPKTVVTKPCLLAYHHFRSGSQAWLWY